jgi:hypothetical protein
MSVYVTDTHPLIYYAGRNHIQISERARDAFEQAAERRDVYPNPGSGAVGSLDARTGRTHQTT